MYQVEASLAAWKKLYLELAEAQLRLKSARMQLCESATVEILRAEVDRLQGESDRALDAVHAEMARFKTKAQKPPPAPPDQLQAN